MCASYELERYDIFLGAAASKPNLFASGSLFLSCSLAFPFWFFPHAFPSLPSSHLSVVVSCIASLHHHAIPCTSLSATLGSRCFSLPRTSAGSCYFYAILLIGPPLSAIFLCDPSDLLSYHQVCSDCSQARRQVPLSLHLLLVVVVAPKPMIFDSPRFFGGKMKKKSTDNMCNVGGVPVFLATVTRMLMSPAETETL